MIDTLNIYLSQSHLRDIDTLAEIPNYLTDIKEYNSERGGAAVKGNLSNLRINAKEHGVFIEGSLSKYLQGENVRTPDYSGVCMALEKLSDELRIRPSDLSKAVIKRIDLAATLRMNHLETEYFRYLGYKPRHYRYEQESTIYYNSTAKKKENKRSQELFYSKTEEIKGLVIPTLRDSERGKLLRHEVRILKPKKYFNGTVTLNQLKDKGFYSKCVDKWSDEYSSIKKISSIMPDYAMVKDAKNFNDYILAKYLNLVGVDEVLRIPEDFKKNKIFDREEYYSRVRRKLLERLEYISQFSEHDLAKELNEKIALAAAEQIEGLKV
jgi:hypothetical protein